MAEFVVTTAVEKLTNLLTQEAVLLGGVSDKVEQLRDELRWMQSFLKDADAEQERNERFRTWLSQIREVATDAEDVIETYIYKAASQSSWNPIAKLINLHNVGRRIAKIQSRMTNISSQKDHFGITSIRSQGGDEGSRSERMRRWRQPSPVIKEDDDLVGLVEDTKALLTQLSSMEQRRCVLSIVGMGGLGKTTLAKKLYNHIDIEKQFDCRSFVYVSKEYNGRDILQRIIMDVSSSKKEALEKMEEDDLGKMLYEILKERRYLLVLDDVWEQEVFDRIAAAFPDGNKGSKLILTTRNMEVAAHADPMGVPHQLRFLEENESLELLCKKALPGRAHLPLDLEKLGRDIVAKCGGLPLAVVVLGGLLSGKRKTPEEWQRVLQNISSRLIGEGSHVSAILALSYNDLPFELKSCFLHVGVFPEDYSISRKKLMRLWVAEGFLPQEEGEQTAEDVAENCLDELINRCMIQVGTRTTLGRVKTIRIHDLLRDFSVSKGKVQNFLGIYSGHKFDQSSPPSSPSMKFRRLAIHANWDSPSDHDKYAFLKPYAPYLRSILFFVTPGKNSNIDLILKNCMLLRVVFSPRVIYKIPHALGKLTQLKYLELCAEGRKIPISIGNLKNLQTLRLIIEGGEVYVPNVIWKMKNLRHLELRHWGYCMNSENLRLDTLRHLQTLKYISGRWIEDGGLASMTNLQQLYIEGLSVEKVMSVISIIGRFRYLKTLMLRMTPGEPFGALVSLSQCEHLQKLWLEGRIEKQPDHPLEFPPNLVKLTLYFTHLQQDSIAKLERLPNLKMLVLGSESYAEKKLVCSSRGFPHLQILHLNGVDHLEELIAEEGAMMNLKSLKIIWSCKKLREFPERFKSLTTLDSIWPTTHYNYLNKLLQPLAV